MSPSGLFCFADDFELVYWAIGLMHEFAIKGKKSPMRYHTVLCSCTSSDLD